MANTAEVVHRFKPGEDVAVKAEEETLFAGRCIAVPAGKSAQGDLLGVYPAEGAANIFGVSDRETADPDAEPAPEPNSWTLRTNVTRPGAIVRVSCEAEVKAGDEVQVAKKGQIKKQTGEGAKIGKAVTTATKDNYAEVILY